MAYTRLALLQGTAWQTVVFLAGLLPYVSCRLDMRTCLPWTGTRSGFIIMLRALESHVCEA